MPTAPVVVAFDVNETLSDLSPLSARFASVGAPEHLAPLWFASVLRDGFALTAAGGQERFAVIAQHAARVVLSGVPLTRSLDDAVQELLTGFMDLDVHPDVPAAVRRLRSAGVRLITFSNGSAAVARALLERAGLGAEFESLLSVEQAGAWKPEPTSYAYAAAVCEVAPHEMMLVAVHPWDVDGAARAGLRTAWVNRDGVPFPGYLVAPELTVSSLTDLADVLAP